MDAQNNVWTVFVYIVHFVYIVQCVYILYRFCIHCTVFVYICIIQFLYTLYSFYIHCTFLYTLYSVFSFKLGCLVKRGHSSFFTLRVEGRTASPPLLPVVRGGRQLRGVGHCWAGEALKCGGGGVDAERDPLGPQLGGDELVQLLLYLQQIIYWIIKNTLIIYRSSLTDQSIYPKLKTKNQSFSLYLFQNGKRPWRISQVCYFYITLFTLVSSDSQLSSKESSETGSKSRVYCLMPPAVLQKNKKLDHWNLVLIPSVLSYATSSTAINKIESSKPGSNPSCTVLCQEQYCNKQIIEPLKPGSNLDCTV